MAEQQERGRDERHHQRVLAVGQPTVLQKLLDIRVTREIVAGERVRYDKEEDQEADAQKRTFGMCR
jgi:hypothetical protein